MQEPRPVMLQGRALCTTNYVNLLHLRNVCKQHRHLRFIQTHTEQSTVERAQRKGKPALCVYMHVCVSWSLTLETFSFGNFSLPALEPLIWLSFVCLRLQMHCVIFIHCVDQDLESAERVG